MQIYQPISFVSISNARLPGPDESRVGKKSFLGGAVHQNEVCSLCPLSSCRCFQDGKKARSLAMDMGQIPTPTVIDKLMDFQDGRAVIH